MIPVNRPHITPRAQQLVAECLKEGWISSEGPWIQRFEADMARMVGVRHAIAVANGTAALDIAVRGLGIGPGHEVILPSLTIISCASAIVQAGAIPVPVDVDPVTWNLDSSAVERAITPRTRAIMPVHLYGLPVDMDPILDLAKARGLLVIEDAAEAHGLQYKGRQCGSMGNASIFSFYANKHVTTGEGGMVLTDDDTVASRCRYLRNLCFGPVRFIHDELGWNYRMASLQAALGIASLEDLPNTIARKRRLGADYRTALAGVPGITMAPVSTAYATNDYWVFGVVLDEKSGLRADEMAKRLANRDVATRPFFHPIHQQPALRKRAVPMTERCPVSERLSQQGFYLPSGIGTTDDEVQSAALALKELLS